MNVRLDPSPRKSAPRRRGQTVTEFAIITFLVAVGTIGVVGLFGNNLRQLFGSSADAIASDTNVQNGGTKASAGLLKWSMKGAQGGRGNPGGTANSPPVGGNPGGTANKPSAGNPGGTTNSQPNPGGTFSGGGNPGGSSNLELSTD